MIIDRRALALWAKTLRGNRGVVLPVGAWHPLVCHGVDADSVAGWLWRELLCASVRSVLAETCDEATALRRVRVLAALHDLGKASPVFQVQDKVRAEALRLLGLDMARARGGAGSLWHSTLSARFLCEELSRRGASSAASAWPALIVGGHHGSFPSGRWYVAGSRTQRGVGPWQEVRGGLVDALLQRVESRVEDWEPIPGLPAQMLMAGLVILADWLASNAELFPLASGVPNDYAARAEALAPGARDVLGIAGTFHPDPQIATDIDRLFATRWPDLPGDGARPFQRVVHEFAASRTGPGLMILEDSMGGGKTEAALASAELLAAVCGLNGVYIGLPTQATANQIFGRTQRWLSTFGAPVTVTLAHGKAARQKDYRALPLYDINGDHDELVVASEWTHGSKRALLAPVAIGTVDQLLLAGVAARHVALRHLALAGKVVIVDEVHAYDAYMSAILCRVLEWLGAYLVPVILLSATVPAATRAALAAAYAGEPTSPIEQGQYPRLTWVDAPGGAGSPAVVTRTCPPSGQRSARCELLAENDDAAVPELVGDLVGDGGCALVIRNTVRRAQQTYRALHHQFSADELTLAHAAFTLADRRRWESTLEDRFGRVGKPARPERHIVVATAVAEQSLDIDLDVLVTDLAPIDLLLQRLGRILRHTRTDRAVGFDIARMIVVGHRGVHEAPPPVFPFGSRSVYGEHLLLRTAAVLLDRPELRLPSDIPELVDQVYSDIRLGPPAWRSAFDRAAAEWTEEHDRITRYAENVLLDRPTAESLAAIAAHDDEQPEDGETTALSHVRLGPPSVEALLLRTTGDPGTAVTASYGAPAEIPLDTTPPEDVMDTLLDQTIRLPASLSRAVLAGELGDAVRPNPAWAGSPWLRKQPVLLLAPGQEASQLGAWTCTYDSAEGLDARRGASGGSAS